MKYLIRSTAVYNGHDALPSPESILVEDGVIRKILPYDVNVEALLDKREAEVLPDKKEAGSLPDKMNAESLPDGIKVLDFGDRLVMPGFIDAHTHFFTGAMENSEHVCSEIADSVSEDDCARIVGEYAAKHPEEKVIRGSGWFLPKWRTTTLPTKKSLDAVVPDRPVLLKCADAHSYWLNSAALQLCGITQDMKPESGSVGLLPDGELSGMLIEPAAYEPADKVFRTFPDDEYRKIIEDFERVLAGYGITALSEMFAPDYNEENNHLCEMIHSMAEEDRMSAHLYLFPRLFGYTDFSAAEKWKKQFAGKWFDIPGVKGFLDGVTETYTGLLLKPYTDRPDTCGIGVPLREYDDVRQSVIAANREGFSVRLHCIADGSVRMALNLFEDSIRANGDRDYHNTIEHIENIDPSDIPRFRKLHVIPSMQPAHLVLDENGKILHIGKERIRYEWPLRSMAEATGTLAIGTDFPVVGIDPFQTIYTAVTRKDYQHHPTGFNPEEKLTMLQVLSGYTFNAARAYHMEDKIGSLEEGKYADIIVLKENLFTMPEEEIMDNQVVFTMCCGKITNDALKIYEKVKK